MQYDYFYGAQAEQFSFYRIPKALFRAVGMTALFFFCKKDVHNAQLHRIKFRQSDGFSLKAEEVPIMV